MSKEEIAVKLLTYLWYGILIFAISWCVYR